MTVYNRRYTSLGVGSTVFQQFALGWMLYNRRYSVREGSNRRQQQQSLHLLRMNFMYL